VIVHRGIGAWLAAKTDLGGSTTGLSLGFVPTMGNLHAGHAALLARARQDCGTTLLSIFVNPTQFDDPTDLERYPRTLEADLAIAQAAGVDHVLLPTPAELSPDGYTYKVQESAVSTVLCGASRPGHFDGVLTVVMKLLNLVRPARAYFGEKDHQQLTLIRDMVQAFFKYTPDADKATFFRTEVMTRLAGTPRLQNMISEGTTAEEIIASWQDELSAFGTVRQRHLLY
jgi:pantoate--beta-alanine ligase